jgi:sec-independent protein translocase protein TatA
MNTYTLAFIQGWEWVIILLAVLLLFGAKKLPELAKGLGKGIREFKKASSEISYEMDQESNRQDYEREQARREKEDKADSSEAKPAKAEVEETKDSSESKA